jgi:hypothetical protein
MPVLPALAAVVPAAPGPVVPADGVPPVVMDGAMTPPFGESEHETEHRHTASSTVSRIATSLSTNS